MDSPPGAKTSAEVAAAFRRSIAPDLYSPGLFVPWTAIEGTSGRLRDALSRLQTSVDRGLTKSDLAAALADEPALLEIVRYLFAAPQGAGFDDGRELPATIPTSKSGIRELAGLLIDLGLRRLLPKGVNLESVLKVALIGNDARSRGYRRRDAIEQRIVTVLQSALDQVREQTGLQVERLAAARYPSALRNRVDDALAVDGHVVAGVVTIFQAQSGGRQQRELSFTYPKLQEDLDDLPAHLILIADGRGLAETPPRIIRQLAESVAALLTITQAEAGGLREAIEDAVKSRGARPGQLGAEALISNILTQNGTVVADQLPWPRDRAVLELAHFQALRPDSALALDSNSGTLSWEVPERVLPAVRLANEFEPHVALDTLVSLLQARAEGEVRLDRPGAVALEAHLPEDRVLPPQMVIAAYAGQPDEALVRAVARAARSQVADARVTVLIARDAPEWLGTTAQRKIQSTLASSVVSLASQDLITISSAKSPRDAFVRFVLEQADLSKANPFNYTGVTPREMFVGREAEVASLRAILSTNSAALLGGRRIGKTSLMQRALETLGEDGWNAHYLDCQAAGDWASFRSLLRARWGVRLDGPFSASQPYELVSDLAAKATGPLVLFLDEVDALLRWDQARHRGSHATEALFRTFRAISQERLAQFVFSGERLVAERLWDPASPHWNFCRPVAVQQLTRPAADDLILEPLRELGVSVVDPPAFSEAVWTATQGHPRLVQYLGDRLVHRLNQRDPEARSTVEPDDVKAIVSTGQFRMEYASTYWGQATSFEKFITALVARGDKTTVEHLLLESSAASSVSATAVRQAIQMLELYGILEQNREPLVLRASWFPEALTAFGGAESVVAEMRGELR